MDSELREELARVARPVVPWPEPYRRLLERARRRRRRRAGAGAAALAVVVAAVPLLAGVLDRPGADPATPPGASEFQPAAPVNDPLARRLLDSPTRGNLAGDRALVDRIARGYLAARTELLVDPALDTVRVLLAHDLPNGRTVVVAFLDDTHALLRKAVAAPGASVPELIDRTSTPLDPDPALPYVTTGINMLGVVENATGLAPAGCLAETSVDGRLTDGGTVVRTWQLASRDGLIVRGPEAVRERWRFSCDGVVLYTGPATGIGRELPRPDASAVPADVPAGTDPTIAANAGRELTETLQVNGFAATPPRVVWAGRIPGTADDAPPAVLVAGCWSTGGCAAVLQVGDGRMDQSDVFVPWQTGVGRPDLVTAQIPNDERHILVVASRSATRAELRDTAGRVLASGTLDGGVGRLARPARAVATIAVYGAADRPLTTMPAVLELRSRQFGEPLVWSR
ncbi:hypothetical protein [Plantactinospora sp. CA-290183]|uniref:hypothetical protein n=1 Tax=Plantactinospora sp. CA-290183 TaxID=3240006 RepID=UPI003D902A72